MEKLSLTKMVCIIFVFCWAVAIASPAQTFKTLVNFSGTDGSTPGGQLAQGFDGDLYGTTGVGGASGDGTVFKITPNGTLTTLHSFDGTDGLNEFGDPAIQATNGKFYGTTEAGGANGFGTAYEMTSAGVLTTLYSFCAQTNCADGAYPRGLVQATNGNFYGATCCGGAYGEGTLFEINPAGKLTVLYSFCAQTNCADGADPFVPVQAIDGEFYGTTYQGGANGEGTVFKITPNGTLTTLHSFVGAEGSGPFAGLVQAGNNNFYGTTLNGGTNGEGTVFKITPNGTLTTLHSFVGADGANPGAALVQATDGSFYGTTTYGGTNGDGTVFKIAPSGTLTMLHSFCAQSGCPDGGLPYARLLQATNGILYGTTPRGGGTSNDGTVFSLGVGLGPFVETNPTSAKVGAKIGILGQGFNGTTSVMLNGAPANFTVISDTFIKATVPAGAATGYVTVTTPAGVLTSNVPFQVIP